MTWHISLNNKNMNRAIRLDSVIATVEDGSKGADDGIDNELLLQELQSGNGSI